VTEGFIAHYRITGKLGAGGMGEVFRATDTKLDREVAVKVLPESFSQDKERLARFDREAKILASLNHPNIAAIHGLEESGDTHALVLELVEGETLAERLKKGPLPVEEALEVCKQIAEALEAAHEKGIIHRDLKPGNVKFTADGQVKVLDFGLAKAMGDELGQASSTEDSPTVTDNFTKPGTILGTAAYMSPEQARGKHVDKRSDIWALGCVLYECLAGKRPFHGEDVTQILAKIIEGEPDWTSLPENTPPTIHLLLRKCLNKDRKRRLQHIDDARIDVEQANDDLRTSSLGLAVDGFEAGTKKQTTKWFYALPWSVALLTSTLAVGVVLMSPRRVSDSRDSIVQTYAVNLHPETHLTTAANMGTSIVIAPDCSKIVYFGARDSVTQVFWKGINEPSFKPIPQSADATPPLIFSPMSDQLAFVSEGWLKVFSFQGGLPRKLVKSGTLTGAIWLSEDRILFTSVNGLFSFNLSESEMAQEILTTDRDKGEVLFAQPSVLPGLNTILFAMLSTNNVISVDAVDLSSKERKGIGLRDSRTTFYHAKTGHLLYGRDDILWARKFNPDTLSFSGSEISLISDLGRDWAGNGHQFSVANNGTLVYARGHQTNPLYQLVLAKDDGTQEVVPLKAGDYQLPRLASDGQSALLRGAESGKALIVNLSNGSASEFEIPFDNFFPIEFDGRYLYYNSGDIVDEVQTLYRKGIGDEGPGEIMLKPQVPRSGTMAVSISKTLLAIVEMPSFETGDIWIHDSSTGDDMKPFLNSSASEAGPRFSPDERWLTYSSNQSGLYEVYVRSLAGDGLPVQVSENGGSMPEWSPDGKRLYFRAGDKTRIMVAELRSEDPLAFGKPRVFVRGIFRSMGLSNGASFDVRATEDGDQIILLKSIHDEPEPEFATKVAVLVNFDEFIARKAAAQQGQGAVQ